MFMMASILQSMNIVRLEFNLRFQCFHQREIQFNFKCFAEYTFQENPNKITHHRYISVKKGEKLGENLMVYA